MVTILVLPKYMKLHNKQSNKLKGWYSKKKILPKFSQPKSKIQNLQMEMDISPNKKKELHLASVICENKSWVVSTIKQKFFWFTALGEFKMQRMLLLFNQNGTVPLKVRTCYNQSTKRNFSHSKWIINIIMYHSPSSFQHFPHPPPPTFLT